MLATIRRHASGRMMPGSLNAGAAFADNLRAGARIAFGLPLAPDALRADGRQLALALAVLWLGWVLAARMSAGAASGFWIWGVAALAARLYLWLSALALLAWLSGCAGRFVALAVGVLFAAWPVALTAIVVGHLAATLGIEPAGNMRRLFTVALLAWYALTFVRVLRLTSGHAVPRALAAGAAYALALFAITRLMPASPMFYAYPEYTEDTLDVEAVYYRQHALVDRQLAALAPQRPDQIDVYFVTFGAYAGQDVFLREALAARDIVERRFGLGGRSMALVNHTEVVDSLPLANLPNLRRALDGLGRLIDPAQDIAFLFLTSHGSPDASLAADFARLAPNDLHGADLRRALDDAGIGWRIVVISACYSGSFIEALRSPQTLVITAADADSASFGCAHENAWTYFGEAYFAEALPSTGDPVAAFEQARAAIRAREREERKAPSDPQMRLGERMAAQLQAWRGQQPRLAAHCAGSPADAAESCQAPR